MARDGDPFVEEVAGALQASVRLLVQRLRQTQAVEGDLTSSETSALARLDRTGPTTAAELARLERISPPSVRWRNGVSSNGGPTRQTAGAPSSRSRRPARSG